MASMVGEKRKNDAQYGGREQRRVPWWLILLVGFALGIVFTLSMSMGRSGTITASYSGTIPEDLLAQATLLVSEATLNARGIQNHQIEGEFDPFAATATAIIMQATQMASP